jgi:hypothetical protein
MKKYWIHYSHNGENGKALVQSLTEEQAVHNGLSLAEHYHPGEQIKYLNIEVA